MVVEVIFKNGRSIEIECEEFTAKRSTITGELTALNWKQATKTVFHIDLKEVVAVIEK